MIDSGIRALERRTGISGGLGKALRYLFPDHWTFLFGEIALYSFFLLVGTGVFLTLFFEPSTAKTVYDGTYAPLQGREVSRAYASALDLSFDVDAGLLVRQTHHWSALVFVAAITLHLMRVFFTGAFRRPRDLNYYVGLTMLMFAVLEGYAGYSLLDDLLSGIGLAIGNGVALSIPVVGGQISTLIWDGSFPGSEAFMSRLFIVHVLFLPIAIATLLTIHLLLVTRPRHTQFKGPDRTEENVVGTPLWPAYALRSVGLAFVVFAVLFALGGLIQINPVWQWGPYEPHLGTNGAQPDWYLGWLIGALRLMPHFDVTVGDYVLIPNPFWGGILFPLVVFGLLYLWPFLERRWTGDRAAHNLLQRPRDNPGRTACGVAILTWVLTVFFAGSADRAFVQFGIAYEVQIWIYRSAVVILPIAAFFLTLKMARQLRDSEGGGESATPVNRVRDEGRKAGPVAEESP